MNITSVKHADADGYTIVEDGISKSVPNNPDNSHYRAVQQWVASGNTVAPMYTQEELDAQQAAQDERDALEESIRSKLTALGLTTEEMSVLGVPEEDCD